jgi:hypothetical protein
VPIPALNSRRTWLYAGIAAVLAYKWMQGFWAGQLPGFEGLLRAFPWYGTALLALFVIVAHEAAHLVVFPGFPRTERVALGLWPQRLSIYVFFDGPIRRERYLACAAAPFLLLTVLPAALAVAGFLPPAALKPAAWIATFNAMVACVDLTAFTFVATSAPRGSSIVWRQGVTYWVVAERGSG